MDSFGASKWPVYNPKNSECACKIKKIMSEDNTKSETYECLHLTLTAPINNCSRQHFIYLLFSFEENKA